MLLDRFPIAEPEPDPTSTIRERVPEAATSAASSSSAGVVLQAETALPEPTTQAEDHSLHLQSPQPETQTPENNDYSLGQLRERKALMAYQWSRLSVASQSTAHSQQKGKSKGKSVDFVSDSTQAEDQGLHQLSPQQQQSRALHRRAKEDQLCKVQ
jgi:hypothetical protein